MKKLAFFLVFICFSHYLAAGAAPAVSGAQAVTIAAQSGVSVNAGGISVSNGQVGINGLALRFQNAAGSGYEIPLGLSFSYTNEKAAYYPVNYSFTLSPGFRLIIPFFMNDFVKVSGLPGAGISYSATVQSYDNNLAKDDYFTYTAGLSLSAGMEVELFIDKLFSLPYHSLSLAGGLGASLAGTWGETVNDYKDKINSALDQKSYDRKVTASLNLSSFGTSITGIGIRYYY